MGNWFSFKRIITSGSRTGRHKSDKVSESIDKAMGGVDKAMDGVGKAMDVVGTAMDGVGKTIDDIFEGLLTDDDDEGECNFEIWADSKAEVLKAANQLTVKGYTLVEVSQEAAPLKQGLWKAKLTKKKTKG